MPDFMLISTDYDALVYECLDLKQHLFYTDTRTEWLVERCEWAKDMHLNKWHAPEQMTCTRTNALATAAQEITYIQCWCTMSVAFT